MADTFSQQTYDGARNWTTKLVDVSDGTGLFAQVVANISTMSPNPGVHLKVRRIRYTIVNGSVQLLWYATTPVLIAMLGMGADELDFSKVYAGGYPNNGGTGVNGNIILTTNGFMPNSGFTIELECIKGVSLI